VVIVNIFLLMKFWRRRCDEVNSVDRAQRKSTLSKTLKSVLLSTDREEYGFKSEEEKKAIVSALNAVFEDYKI